MAHRSNQAVASQEQPAPQAPDDPPPPRRFLIGWTTAIMALVASTAGVMLALWLLRFPIAAFFIGSALSERGAEADFQIADITLNRAVLSNVRFGSENAPDAAIPRLEARWAWSGLSPRLTGLYVTSPRLRARMDAAGRISAGSLDRLGGGPPGRRRPSLPAIELEIEDGQALIEAPFGALTATFHAAGTLGTNFSALARIAEASRPGQTHALDRGSAELVIVSRDDTIAARLTADVARLVWQGAVLEDAHVRLLARAPLDLARYDVEAAWRLASIDAPSITGNRLSGAIGGEAMVRENSLEPEVWQGQARVNAGALALASNEITSARIDVRIDGREAQGNGRWSLAGESFNGLAMVAQRPNAAGEFTFDLRGDERLNGQAQLALTQAQLNNEAQESLRATFPDLPTAPVGPTFDRAEHALDVAADRFNLTLPLTMDADESGFRLRITEAAEARAASGAVLRLSPLRQDTPALVAEFPSTTVHGAIALELSGGGAPTAALLLDTLDWSPSAPFEADGTLTLSNWSADGASIAANELNIGIAISPQGIGRIDLQGPARVTGPLGEGEVRDMVADLDLAVLWNPGWRVVPNRGCIPIRLGGIDAAGLSFHNGAFSLCALDGALIAADAQRNLSGGFNIRGLGLNGRMAGEHGAPARLSAANVIGRFRGRTGDVTLAVEAQTPSLRIDMAEGRPLAIAMQRATANAHIANNTWRVDGQFDSGSLADPTLPGSVSTITGRWSAAPDENDGPIIRVEAGEALLTANRPASEEERPLFNPLRLTNVDASVRNGRIEATGQILLADRARQLAQFVAQHMIDEGTGDARVIAESIVFGNDLQPYEITEQARGMVENMRGPASLNANILWTRDAITSNGRVGLNGVSLATSTIPVVRDVRGEIYFDNLFELTTPPGQQITVGELNPGIAVHNGRVSFQLLPEQQVSIERAEFDFASGILAMAPTTIRLGAEETQFILTLRDVDAAELINTFEIPDLAATGTVEGNFPLLLTRRSAFIQNGVLRASTEGGTIAYTGNAGGDAAGPARIAFDALRNFRYDALSLTLDGDLNGEVVSSIEFSGHNAGGAVDLGQIAPIPGVGSVTVRGVPFDFNVRVSAPFRSLAQTAATITDPTALLNRAQGDDSEDEDQEGATERTEPVDQGGPGTR
ncbi:Dicarboxylate transport [Terricaulis silvestris]|uniref:Dicarboxylate transport n=2 Tax=Terricaulis silvestris TaxID=2686094 RepID=A0A6I6MGY6_9CAUL|nr:Dicarboxylate transport [Terricaulis silvestris]